MSFFLNYVTVCFGFFSTVGCIFLIDIIYTFCIYMIANDLTSAAFYVLKPKVEKKEHLKLLIPV